MTILATIIVLGVLIFVHELGHFMAAKAVGISVQRFSIGFGPRVVGFTRGETEYLLSWIPLGGYVKMGGMDDEVMERIEGGARAEPRQPGPRDFDAKPIWARTLVISAGVIMNMVFALALYVTVNAAWGLQERDVTRVGKVEAGLVPPGAEALLQIPVGSRITRIGDQPVEHWGHIRDGLWRAEPGPLSIQVDGLEASLQIDVPADPETQRRMAAAVEPWIPAVVGPVNPASPAEKGGLEEDDSIVAVGGVPVGTWYEFVEQIQGRPGQRTQITLERSGRRLTRYVTPEESTREDPVTGESVEVGLVGIFPPAPDFVYIRVPFSEAVVLGYGDTVFITKLIVGFLRDLFTGGVSPRSLGSIVTIGAASGEAAAAGMGTFLQFMALFSVNLAVLNLLPIPILDGGHLVFLAIEAVRGKALSIEQRVRWSHFGFLLVLGIMVWALSNDILRLFGL
ncbi:MAG: RIP metalloprotease RseP [Gemmatimonadota bacterium]|nr:MAG: RIP metalloprotease RseP [Gemmatimonadota bacterium]